MADDRKRGKRELIHAEPAEGIDEGGFADKLADALIEEIERDRRKRGLPPLED